MYTMIDPEERGGGGGELAKQLGGRARAYKTYWVRDLGERDKQ